MTHTTQTTALYVGIDVSQNTLTVALYPTDEVWTLVNDPHSHTALVQHLAQLPVQRVLLESSGGYEKAVVSALQQAGLPVVVVRQNSRVVGASGAVGAGVGARKEASADGDE
jgi:transposase